VEVFTNSEKISQNYINFNTEGKGSNKDKCTFVLYISVNSIVKNRECSTEDNNTSKQNLKLDFSEKDFEAFKEIQSEPDVFKYSHI
jgi:hypothetical protein